MAFTKARATQNCRFFFFVAMRLSWFRARCGPCPLDRGLRIGSVESHRGRVMKSVVDRLPHLTPRPCPKTPCSKRHRSTPLSPGVPHCGRGPSQSGRHRSPPRVRNTRAPAPAQRRVGTARGGHFIQTRIAAAGPSRGARPRGGGITWPFSCRASAHACRTCRPRTRPTRGRGSRRGRGRRPA